MITKQYVKKNNNNNNSGTMSIYFSFASFYLVQSQLENIASKVGEWYVSRVGVSVFDRQTDTGEGERIILS